MRRPATRWPERSWGRAIWKVHCGRDVKLDPAPGRNSSMRSQTSEWIPRDSRTALELTSNEAVLEATASGELVAAVSELAARSFVAAGRLTKLRFDLPDRHFDLVVHRERSRSPAAAAFVKGL